MTVLLTIESVALRVVVPYLAGSVGYPLPRWLALDTLGLAGWIAFGFSLGYFAEGPLSRMGDADENRRGYRDEGLNLS